MDATMALLLAEREIGQQLNNYCRAMDRCDRELGRAVFHPDAEADYGAMYKGSAEGFVDFALAGHLHLETHVHRVTNISIVVDGDTAGSESYVDARFRMSRDGTVVEMHSSGRFIDRWERRDGRWGIAQRRYLHCMDSARPLEGANYPSAGERDQSDPSYAILASPVQLFVPDVLATLRGENPRRRWRGWTWDQLSQRR